MDYEISQEVITPEYAAELLELNYENQRSVTWRKVEEYAADMANGLWDEGVFDPIHITTDGTLINGQHRLQAIVRSGVPIKLYMCYGGSESQYKYLDGGMPRSVAAVIKAPNANEAASISRVLFCLIQGSTINEALNGKLSSNKRAVRDASKKKSSGAAQCSPSRGEIISFYNENVDMVDELVRHGQHLYKTLKVGNKTVFGAFIWIARRCGLEDSCTAFTDDMEDIPHKTAAAQVTVQTLMSLKTSARISGGNNRINQLGTLLRGFDAYISNQNLRLIKNQTAVCEKWTERLRTAMKNA